MEHWTPGRRQAQRQLETPYELVPDHLLGPLLDWSHNMYQSNPSLVQRIGIEFRLRFTRDGASQLQSWTVDDAGLHLDVIEFLLQTQCAHEIYDADYRAAEALEALLLTGNSAYKVREDNSGLEMRTTPEVQAQVQAVVRTATGSAGLHLANAWNEAYSRTPDPVKSYSESIKAVEAALAPVVSPNNLKATLGTLIGTVNGDPSKFKFAITAAQSTDGIQVVLGLMRLLWEGQTSRHGGVNPTRHETDEEAQAAVHLASTLVQYGVSGAFAAK